MVVDTSLERWAVAQVPDWDGEAGLGWGSVAVRRGVAAAANLECFGYRLRVRIRCLVLGFGMEVYIYVSPFMDLKS